MLKNRIHFPPDSRGAAVRIVGKDTEMKESTRKIDDFFAKAFHIMGKLLKFTFYAIIIGINAILIWRLASRGDPALMETLMVNERTASAYAEAGKQMEVLYQEQYYINEDGLFAQSNLRYIPSISQLQITARYNNSTIRAMAETFELAEVPGRDEEIFDVTLVKVIGLTDKEQAQADVDALSADVIGEDAEAAGTPRKEVRYFPSDSLADKKNVYNYRRLIFEDVDLSDASELYLEFYYNGAVNYDAEPYSEILIWVEGESYPYTLTKKDLKALKAGAVNYD